MKNIFLASLFVTTLLSCQNRVETQFSKAALNDVLLTLNDDSILFKSILEKHQGKTVFIDVWASWCKDCLKGLPSVKALQTEHPEVDFVYLSLDKTQKAWKKGIKRLEIKGDHYFMKSGWKGAMGTFLDLDWIPRYMIIDKQGKIKVFKAIETTDITLLNNLK
ncbi:thioredoxin-like domain-containing protein [Flavobacteriaceae bacterium]|jgi:thiol-disulfide isomerase/thioredoxin|nr:thioredoxin-like domain-containing protein [Flavobacteriaceae bacterium]